MRCVHWGVATPTDGSFLYPLREMEGRQVAELRKREVEIEHRALKATNQQVRGEEGKGRRGHSYKEALIGNTCTAVTLACTLLSLLSFLPCLQQKDELLELSSQLRVEKETRQLQEGVFKEQIRCHSLLPLSPPPLPSTSLPLSLSPSISPSCCQVVLQLLNNTFRI